MSVLDDAEREALHDVFTKAAVEVVDDIERVLCQPMLDTTPVSPKDFRGVDFRWLDSATRALVELGFVHVRDIDGTPLLSEGSPPAIIRVMLGDANTVAVALYHARPRSPGFFSKLLLMVLGKWPKSPRIVELTSYLDEGVVTTSNQGDLNVFSPPPFAFQKSLPLGTPVHLVVEAHREHLALVGGRVIPRMLSGFDDMNREREKTRRATNAWREQVGLGENELARLLAPHGEQGQKLRSFIVRELWRRGMWKHDVTERHEEKRT